MSHCSYCHRPFIPDISGFEPTPIQALGEDDTFIVHANCAAEINTRLHHETNPRKKSKLMLTILQGMSMCLIFVLTLHAEVKAEKDWVKGAVVVAVGNDGSCVFKPFVQVGDAEDDDEGNAQILGYSAGNVQVDRQGRVIWERVPERTFIRQNSARVVNGRMCHAPPYNQ